LSEFEQLLNKDAQQFLLLIDIVRFSDVSSNFGYDYGNKVLLEIACRIAYLFNDSANLVELEVMFWFNHVWRTSPRAT
jgi:GGDEF domain-containing protein